MLKGVTHGKLKIPALKMFIKLFFFKYLKKIKHNQHKAKIAW